MSPLLLRAVERLAALVIGAMSIYLGYNLFLRLTDVTAELSKGSGTLRLPGIGVTISQVGPGVFFALFGATVVWLSVRTQMRYAQQEAAGASSPAHPGEGTGRTEVVYFGGAEGVTDDQVVRSLRSQLRRDFRTLDRIVSALEARNLGALSASELADCISVVPRLKESLLRTVWGPDWGDYSAFRKWIKGGSPEPPPEGLAEPARLFREGSAERP